MILGMIFMHRAISWSVKGNQHDVLNLMPESPEKKEKEEKEVEFVETN